MLWILLTLAAAPLQVARNAMQRGLVGDAGPWGATLVRFLFGLPFSIAIFGIAVLLNPGATPHWGVPFWSGAIIGAISQVTATAILLMAMSRSGFAVATMLQQSSLPLAAIMGWLVLGDQLSSGVWAGVAVATMGLLVLSWPRRGTAAPTWSAGCWAWRPAPRSPSRSTASARRGNPWTPNTRSSPRARPSWSPRRCSRWC